MGTETTFDRLTYALQNVVPRRFYTTSLCELDENQICSRLTNSYLLIVSKCSTRVHIFMVLMFNVMQCNVV